MNNYRFAKLFCIAIGMFSFQMLNAQEHYNMWLRGTFSWAPSKKFKFDQEFQHRRQNGIDNLNFLDKNLMFTYRNWIHYQHNETIKFSLSPFAYFSNYKIIQKETDEVATPNNEFRFTVAVELQNKIYKHFFWVNRTAIEYRIFENSSANVGRYRNRLGLGYELSKSTKILLFDELLLNISYPLKDHFFDHNRIGITIEKKLTPKIKLDLGYININRLPANSNTELNENNFILNLTYMWDK